MYQYLVDWSLSGIMTSKRVIRESESPRPAASSILISRMTRFSVIIPYRDYALLGASASQVDFLNEASYRSYKNTFPDI